MKLAIVGLPQTGKKTLYSLLTDQELNQDKIKSEKEAVLGKAIIRDQRFEQLVNMYQPKSRVPGSIEFLLLPPLQNEAAKDNETFRSLENVDAICCVVREFKDDAVYHLLGSVDHSRDLRLFLSESVLLDLLFVEKRIERIDKELRSKNDPLKIKEKQLMERLRTHLEKEQPLRVFRFADEDYEIIRSYPFISLKPVIVIVNVAESSINDEVIIKKLQEEYKDALIDFITISVKIEQEISLFDTEESRVMFMEEIGIKEQAINQLTLQAYKTIGLITYFTVGKDEVRAWMVKRGSTAPRAARAIHEDFERGFIRGEVIKYEDLIALGSEAKVKEAGKLLVKGKDYIVEDGDIISFLFNV